MSSFQGLQIKGLESSCCTGRVFNPIVEICTFMVGFLAMDFFISLRIGQMHSDARIHTLQCEAGTSLNEHHL